MITKDTNFAVDMSPARLEWAIYNFPAALSPEKEIVKKEKILNTTHFIIASRIFELVCLCLI